MSVCAFKSANPAIASLALSKDEENQKENLLIYANLQVNKMGRLTIASQYFFACRKLEVERKQSVFRTLVGSEIFPYTFNWFKHQFNIIENYHLLHLIIIFAEV